MNSEQFTIQVLEDRDSYLVCFVSATGRIMLSRSLASLDQAEDERDFIYAGIAEGGIARIVNPLPEKQEP